ncbi:hypothetical protein BH11MYX1_BH11MYX1_50010 [soil metagenome]
MRTRRSALVERSERPRGRRSLVLVGWVENEDADFRLERGTGSSVRRGAPTWAHRSTSRTRNPTPWCAGPSRTTGPSSHGGAFNPSAQVARVARLLDEDNERGVRARLHLAHRIGSHACESRRLPRAGRIGSPPRLRSCDGGDTSAGARAWDGERRGRAFLERRSRIERSARSAHVGASIWIDVSAVESERAGIPVARERSVSSGRVGASIVTVQGSGKLDHLDRL